MIWIVICPRCKTVGVFAIYQILLGWKTRKYFYETDELPNPRPTQPKKKIGRKWHFEPLFSHSKVFFRGLGLILFMLTLQETQPNQILRKHPTGYYGST